MKATPLKPVRAIALRPGGRCGCIKCVRDDAAGEAARDAWCAQERRNQPTRETVMPKGPIDCRVRQTTDGEWIAVARRGSGQEGRTVTGAHAPGPAAAAQEAITALLAEEAQPTHLEVPHAR